MNMKRNCECKSIAIADSLCCGFDILHDEVDRVQFVHKWNIHKLQDRSTFTQLLDTWSLKSIMYRCVCICTL